MSKKDYAAIEDVKTRTKVCFWLNLGIAIVLYLFFNISRPSDLSIWMSAFILIAIIVLAVLNFCTLYKRIRNNVVVSHRKQLISWSLLCASAKFSLAMLVAAIFGSSTRAAEAYILCCGGVDSLYFELVGLFGTKLKFRHLLLQFGVFTGLIVLSLATNIIRTGSVNKYELVYVSAFLFGMVFASVFVGYFLAKMLLRFVYKPLKDAKLEEEERAKNASFVKGKYFRSNATKVEKGKITSEPETIRGKLTLKQKAAKAALRVIGAKDKKTAKTQKEDKKDSVKKTEAKKSSTKKKTGKKKN